MRQKTYFSPLVLIRSQKHGGGCHNFLGGVSSIATTELLLLLIEGNIDMVMRAILERPGPSMWEQLCMSQCLLINQYMQRKIAVLRNMPFSYCPY